MVGDDAASKQCKEEESLVARGISYAAGMVAVWVLVWAVVRTARGRIFVRPTPLTNVKFCLGGQRDIQWLLQERVCPRKTPHRHSVAPPPNQCSEISDHDGQAAASQPQASKASCQERHHTQPLL